MAGGKESLYYDEAERLYRAGHTLEKIRELLPEPVSLATLSRWSQKGDWPAQRKVVMASLRNVADILQEALEEAIVALRTKGGLDATAFDSICKTTASIERLRRMDQERGTGSGIDRPAVFLEDLEFIIQTLKEIDPEGLKIVARNFEEIVSRGKKKYAQTA